MADVALTPAQQATLHHLIATGGVDEADLHRQEKLSLWALERRGLASQHGEKWAPTDTGRAWGKHPNGLLDVIVQCSRCGAVLTVASPGTTARVTCACQRVVKIHGPRVQREGTVPGQAVAAAAARIMAGRMSGQHETILTHYAAAGQRGLTQPELERLRGVDTRAHRTRRLELFEAGYLEDAGERRRLPHAGPSGRRGALASVYRITPAGARQARG